MSVGIYMITNKINGKRYIGKSVRIERRFIEHRSAKTNMAISKAIREYGPDGFTYEILELCSEDMLDERESYWIDYYNTYSGNGYNAAPGGEGAPHKVKLSDNDVLDIANMLANEDTPLYDIAKKYGVSKKTISDINLGHSRVNITGQTYEFPIRKINKCYCIKTIEELHELLKENNNNIDDVANIIGCTRVTIYNWLRQNRLGCYDIEQKSLHNGVEQIDIETGKILNIYSSASVAAKSIGKKNHGAIHNVASGIGKTAYGYMWKYI